jgi:hypothetical protein
MSSLGIADNIPDCPPSNPGTGRDLLALACHPFVPLPDVFPFPDRSPRPTLLAFLLAPGLSRTLLAVRNLVGFKRLGKRVDSTLCICRLSWLWELETDLGKKIKKT